MLRQRPSDVEEAKVWSKMKKAAVDPKVLLLSGGITLAATVILTYKATSMHPETIAENMDLIKSGLPENGSLSQMDPALVDHILKQAPEFHKECMATFDKIAVELAKQSNGGRAAAAALFVSLIAKADILLENGGPALRELADQMKKYILNVTNDYNSLRAVALGGAGLILLSVFLANYLEATRNIIDPTNKSAPKVFAGGALALTMIALIGLRTEQCFNDPDNAPRGYVCSKAQDPTMSAVNNGMISLSFFGAATLALKFVGSCFAHGTKNTASALWEGAKETPGALYQSAINVKNRIAVTIWAEPGSEVAYHAAEGGEDVRLSVSDRKTFQGADTQYGPITGHVPTAPRSPGSSHG